MEGDDYRVTRTRALATERERRYIAGEGSDKQRYEATSRVRGRIATEFRRDLAVFTEHNPELLDEVRSIVDDVEGDE